ncbi:MAG TPA: response regulator transcription factor [Hyphomonadaceae bacterium]|nr:response regulator transcription factor [Hyphomonadaceae bacterium]HPN04283.1 response regulator transcription factor [Hyphomonadaceae bacterium]
MNTAQSQGEILIVDDDQALRETLADFFEMEGYSILQAANAAEARTTLSRAAPDLILLDINMPGGDGLTLAAEIRRHASTPIIILSGKGAMIDRVVGLEVGADDYLAKPFELRELLARARAVLRRSTPKSSTAMQPQTEKTAAFAGLMFSPMRRRVTTRAGEAIDLTGAEFNLLAAFVERANRVLSRDSIADLTRRDDWDAFDRSIDTLVSRLRRKLAPHVDASDLIQTVRGEGYVLAAEVRWSGQGEQVDGS